MRKIGRHLTGWCHRGSYVNRDHVPFKEVLPISLRNRVSGKGDKGSAAPCIQEMSVLFACLKKNDFKEIKCSSELSTFQKCYDGHMAAKKILEDQGKKGNFTPGERKLHFKQVNELLKKFP